MSEKEFAEKLKIEGFSGIYIWEDGPGAYYPDHVHNKLSAHIILDGEMILTVDGKTILLKVGDRYDVPANTVHSARMGKGGCRYIVGEK